MRLMTRSDFDGLACAVLLVENGVVDSYKFVHPKDIQDGKVEATSNDVLANVPYIPGCGLWFDHHMSEEERLEMGSIKFEGATRSAPSAAQVIWDYYGGVDTFGNHFLPLLEAVNKTDSADLTSEEILNPEGWILLSFMMDPRTGLGRFKDYRISNYQLMEELIQHCRNKPVEKILELPDVQERTERYFKHDELFKDMLKWACEIRDNVIITNLMDVETIYVGNRFLIYALNPDQNIEVRVMWGRDKQNIVFACGHSVLNRTSKTNVGKLMLEYGGGGHKQVGTCQVEAEHWREKLEEIVNRMREDG